MQKYGKQNEGEHEKSGFDIKENQKQKTFEKKDAFNQNLKQKDISKSKKQ